MEFGPPNNGRGCKGVANSGHLLRRSETAIEPFGVLREVWKAEAGVFVIPTH